MIDEVQASEVLVLRYLSYNTIFKWEIESLGKTSEDSTKNSLIEIGTVQNYVDESGIHHSIRVLFVPEEAEIGNEYTELTIVGETWGLSEGTWII